ncbi:hypothetical protein KP509_15G053200 [Ceratopteris richardii]|uniref:Uncharacterized protein n=1 Tax=Ceratopteris richardii TaxID=49495 RepID=A0A8T2T748_CERRI|nr:hypothetical protein KP509_15G053200 [Ceratopteris richardii]
MALCCSIASAVSQARIDVMEVIVNDAQAQIFGEPVGKIVSIVSWFGSCTRDYVPQRSRLEEYSDTHGPCQIVGADEHVYGIAAHGGL